MRAAFVAVQAGRQVAVLVPTTLLAEQHAQNFRDRFADWPVRIESLSRFRSGKEAARHPRRHCEQGTVDILIATHRLLHADARFSNLGPDHRRRGTPLRRARQGTPQGAARRGARADADRHADSAHAEHGARRPARAVADHHAAGGRAWPSRPSWASGTAPTIREAALRELRRGGQIYFVHNEIQTIEKIAAELRAAGAGSAASASATARCASATSSS